MPVKSVNEEAIVWTSPLYVNSATFNWTLLNEPTFALLTVKTPFSWEAVII